MIDALTHNLLWAEFDVLESLSRGFRPENKPLGLGDLALIVLFVAAVIGGAWALSRYIGRFDPHRPKRSPRALFTELCQAHSLTWPQRQLLRRLAREHRLEMPAMLFVEPACFDTARLSRTLRARQRDLRQIRRRLFGDSANGTSEAH